MGMAQIIAVGFLALYLCSIGYKFGEDADLSAFCIRVTFWILWAVTLVVGGFFLKP